MKRASDSPRRLASLRVVSIAGATPAALATAVEAWVAANALERTFVQIDYLYNATDGYVALITYTE